MIKISQEQVEYFLEKHTGQWFTSAQLVKELKLSSGSISSNLKRVAIHRTIMRRRSAIRSNIMEYSIIIHNEPMKKKHADSYLSDKEKFLRNNDLEV